MAPWRNGRRCRLKICCPYGRAGSSPAGATIIKFPIFSRIIASSPRDEQRCSMSQFAGISYATKVQLKMSFRDLFTVRKTYPAWENQSKGIRRAHQIACLSGCFSRALPHSKTRPACQSNVPVQHFNFHYRLYEMNPARASPRTKNLCCGA